MLVSKHCEFGKQLVWCHISAGGHSLFSDGESAPTNRVSQKDRAPSRQGLFYVLTTFWPILSSQCTKTSIYLYGRACSTLSVGIPDNCHKGTGHVPRPTFRWKWISFFFKARRPTVETCFMELRRCISWVPLRAKFFRTQKDLKH